MLEKLMSVFITLSLSLSLLARIVGSSLASILILCICSKDTVVGHTGLLEVHLCVVPWSFLFLRFKRVVTDDLYRVYSFLTSMLYNKMYIK